MPAGAPGKESAKGIVSMPNLNVKPFHSRLALAPLALPPRTDNRLSVRVITALEECVSHYAGTKTLSAKSCPGYVKRALTTIGLNCTSLRHRPGNNIVASCCLSLALPEIAERDDIQTLISIREDFNRESSGRDGLVNSHIDAYFNSIEKEIEPNGSVKNFYIPDDTSQHLCSLAYKLGNLSACKLAIKLMEYVLANQEHVNGDDRAMMEESANRFFRLIDIRVRGGRALIEALE